MAKIDKSIMINASSEDIDRYALDASTWSQWVEGVASADSDTTFPEVGGKVETEYKSAGATFHMTMITTDIVHGDHLTMEMDGMITGTQSWQYEAASGGTKVSCIFEYSMKGGGLGAIADKLLIERMNTSNIEKTLENLKAIVER